MQKLLYSLLLILFLGSPCLADIELAPKGKPPLRLTDVYLLHGLSYVALDDVLDAVSLRGHWNSVRHVYRIRTANGWAELSPGWQSLKIGETFYPLKEKPRFIDGRLRVSENFILNQLSMLINRPIYYRNLNPSIAQRGGKDNTLDRLFSFLLRKKNIVAGPGLRGVAIDAGHGGLDTGVITGDGYKEKQATLALSARLSKILKMNLGIPVYLSRDDDYELTPKQRLESVAHEEVDVWLLLHAQGSFTAAAEGVVLFVRSHENSSDGPLDASRQLAEEIKASLEESDVPVVGIFTSPLVPLGQGRLPTVLLELGYLTNPVDLQRLRSSDGQKQLAQALYLGLKNFSLNRKIN